MENSQFLLIVVKHENKMKTSLAVEQLDTYVWDLGPFAEGSKKLLFLKLFSAVNPTQVELN